MLGIKINLKKEISGIYSIPNESAHDWKKVLLDLKQKNEKTMLFISDNLTGINNAINEIYPKSRLQKCIVHLKRNILYKLE